MTNSLTKEVEFANKESNRKVVFEGTYTAKKGDVKLNEFAIAKLASPTSTINRNKDKVTFYLTVDGDEVADVKYTNGSTASDTFDNILIEA
jgi:purine-nucleoside phosphorylase